MEVAIFLLLATIICFLLTLVIISKSHDGRMVVTETEEGKRIFSLELDKDPSELENQRYVSFVVVHKEDD